MFKNKLGRLTALGLALALLLSACTSPDRGSASQSGEEPAISSGGGAETSPGSDAPIEGNDEEPLVASPAGLPDEMRAMWFSYFEVDTFDFSSAEALAVSAGAQFDECVDMGLNTVLVHVRPFGDALYDSSVYPWTHYLTGTQGEDPGYDPLTVLIEEAHARGLRFEAWLNPYRVALSDTLPGTLAADNAAVVNEGWAKPVGNGLYYDPGIPEVRALVIEGVREIVENYAVDGIHFDDYFYPEFNGDAEVDAAFDDDTYAQYGGALSKAEWRRQNNDELVAGVYAAIKAIDPDVSFGISMAGNNDNNYGKLYADVSKWMAQPGYMDYAMPQLYWGYGYALSSGTTRFAFENITEEWAALGRDSSVRLYAGLDASRIGKGDGGDNDPAQWMSGHNMADMIETLRGTEGFAGYALYRYEFLSSNEDPLYRQEAEAVAGVN